MTNHYCVFIFKKSKLTLGVQDHIAVTVFLFLFSNFKHSNEPVLSLTANCCFCSVNSSLLISLFYGALKLIPNICKIHIQNTFQKYSLAIYQRYFLTILHVVFPNRCQNLKIRTKQNCLLKYKCVILSKQSRNLMYWD